MGGLKEKEVLPWLQRAKKKKKMRFRRYQGFENEMKNYLNYLKTVLFLLSFFVGTFLIFFLVYHRLFKKYINEINRFVFYINIKFYFCFL
jgi:hypothetical protein